MIVRDVTSNDYAAFLRNAFDAYLLQLDDVGLDPSESYLPYDFDKIERHRWGTLGREMVEDELREITNILNRWLRSLRQWRAWNIVIAGYGEKDAWELRSEFLEALAHKCLLQPSATRDTLTFVVTNSMHQVRLALGNGYPDHLEGDPGAHDQRPMNLTRRKKEQRLFDLIAPWTEAAPQFIAALCRVDDKLYRESTSDYRNRSSHSIGPRLAIGMTRAVVRTVEPATEMKKQADGTYERTRVPGRMSVCYGFGGILPLDMEDAFIANLDQYRHARTSYECYRHLLAVGMDGMPIVNTAF